PLVRSGRVRLERADALAVGTERGREHRPKARTRSGSRDGEIRAELRVLEVCGLTSGEDERGERVLIGQVTPLRSVRAEAVTAADHDRVALALEHRRGGIFDDEPERFADARMDGLGLELAGQRPRELEELLEHPFAVGDLLVGEAQLLTLALELLGL